MLRGNAPSTLQACVWRVACCVWLLQAKSARGKESASDDHCVLTCYVAFMPHSMLQISVITFLFIGLCSTLGQRNRGRHTSISILSVLEAGIPARGFPRFSVLFSKPKKIIHVGATVGQFWSFGALPGLARVALPVSRPECGPRGTGTSSLERPAQSSRPDWLKTSTSASSTKNIDPCSKCSKCSKS